MPRRIGSKKTRFTLRLPDELISVLTYQQEAAGKGSLAEVIREAVEVYRSLLQAKDPGLQLYLQDSVTGESGRMWLLPGPPPVVRTGRRPADTKRNGKR
jgi:hypothetical protein